jgi:hypothetical protein
MLSSVILRFAFFGRSGLLSAQAFIIDAWFEWPGLLGFSDNRPQVLLLHDAVVFEQPGLANLLLSLEVSVLSEAPASSSLHARSFHLLFLPHFQTYFIIGGNN